jgi:hypothetical protein
MTKTMTIIAMIAGLMLGTALTARAQTPAAGNDMYASVSVGGQFQSRTISETTTFSLFNEDGVVTANQTVGNGFVFDATGGYRIRGRFFVALGLTTFTGKGSAAAIAAIPDPLVFGRPTIKTLTADDFDDVHQTNVAINFQAVWMMPITDKFDLAFFGGPSLIHVKQDLASVTESADATATVKSEGKLTGKAGSAGVDLSYRWNERYSFGAFVRYEGGEANLPSVPNLKVGGVQVAGGVRYRF